MVSDGFAHRLVVGGDEAGLDRGLGPRPALEQAALDQQHIRALAGRGHVMAQVRHAARSQRFGGEPHAGLERGQIVPDIGGPLLRRHQRAAM